MYPRSEHGRPNEGGQPQELPDAAGAAHALPDSGTPNVDRHLDSTGGVSGHGGGYREEAAPPRTDDSDATSGTGDSRSAELGDLGSNSDAKGAAGRAALEGTVAENNLGTGETKKDEGLGGAEVPQPADVGNSPERPSADTERPGEAEADVDDEEARLMLEIEDDLLVMNGPDEIALLKEEEDKAERRWRSVASAGDSDRPEDETEWDEHKVWTSAQHARERAQKRLAEATERVKQRQLDAELERMVSEAMSDDVSREENIRPSDGLPTDLSPKIRGIIAEDFTALPERLRQYIETDNGSIAAQNPDRTQAAQEFLESLQRAGAAANGSDAYEVYQAYVLGRENLRNPPEPGESRVLFSNLDGDPGQESVDRPGTYLEQDLEYEERLTLGGLDYYLTQYEASYAVLAESETADAENARQISQILHNLSAMRMQMLHRPSADGPHLLHTVDSELVDLKRQYDIAIQQDIDSALDLASHPQFYGTLPLRDQPASEMIEPLETLLNGLELLDEYETLEEATDALLASEQKLSELINQAEALDSDIDLKAARPMHEKYNKLLALWSNVIFLNELGVKTPEGASFYYSAKLRQLIWAAGELGDPLEDEE